VFLSVARTMLSTFLTAILVSLVWLAATPSVRTTLAHAVRTGSTSCQRSLILVLRPGRVPPANADWNKPPAPDIPPGPVTERFPLYPGAIPSSVAMPHAVVGILPTYRKVARAEFQLPARYPTVSTWYQHALAACGMPIGGTMPLQQHGGPRFAGLVYISPHWLNWLNLVFRPLSLTTTAVLYVAQTLDLPPRPASSLLHGPFTRVAVDYQATGVLPQSNHRYSFIITWPATIARLAAAINGPTRIWVPVGAGGAVLSSQSVRLSFVRRDGGARPVSVGGVLDRIIVGHTRPLVDLNGKVLKLLTRIVQHRCQPARGC
jgi:hypothetical protein